MSTKEIAVLDKEIDVRKTGEVAIKDEGIEVFRKTEETALDADIEAFLKGYFAEGGDALSESGSGPTSKSTGSRASTARNMGIAADSTRHIETYSKIIEENLKLFDRLDYDHLQGSAARKHGDAAEALGVRDYNREQILKGSENRMELSDSKTDPVTDSVVKNSQGKVIEKAQVKYYETPEKTAKALSESKYRKNNVKYAPPEQVEQIKEYSRKQAQELRKQALEAKRNGNIDEYTAKMEQAKDFSHTAKTVKGLKRTRPEAQDASKNHLSRYKVVGKDTLKDAHEAGKQGLKEAAILSAGISGAQNLTQVVKGEKELGRAVVDTAVDTAKGTAMSYGVKAAGSVVKAGAKHAGEKLGSQALKSFANSAKGPALFVTVTLETGKSLKKYMDGDLGAAELFSELGEKGAGILCAEAGSALGLTVGSAAGAAIGGLIGTFLLPGVGTAGGAAAGAQIGAIVGPLIGSMVGYMVGTQLYLAAKDLLGSLDSEKHRRLQAIYEQAYERMKAERLEMERIIEQHFADRYVMFRQSFLSMEEGLRGNNVNHVSAELDNILGAFGSTLQFKNFREFDDFMLDEGAVLKL